MNLLCWPVLSSLLDVQPGQHILVIGSGSYPVHSLVGILQQGKDTLDSVKGYFNRSAPAAQAVEQRITTVQPAIVPGEPPRVQQSVIETTTAKTTEESPNK